jgi:hypothetical protein
MEKIVITTDQMLQAIVQDVVRTTVTDAIAAAFKYYQPDIRPVLIKSNELPLLSNSQQIMELTGWAKSTFYQKIPQMPANVVIRRGKRLLFNTAKFYEWLQNDGKEGQQNG